MHTPARAPTCCCQLRARFAHARAAPPEAFSRYVPPDPTVVGLPAEELADLVLRLELRLSARRAQVLDVEPADAADEAGGVLDHGGAHLWRSSARAQLAKALQLAAAAARAAHALPQGRTR